MIPHLTWPAARLAELMEALARRSHLPISRSSEAPWEEGPAEEVLADPSALDRWITAAARLLALEAEEAWARHRDLEGVLRAGGPALLRMPDGSFVGLLAGGRRSVVLLGPDLGATRVPLEPMRATLASALEAPLRESVDSLLDEARVRGPRRHRARAALLRDRLGPEQVQGIWHLSLPVGASPWAQLRVTGLARRLGILLGAHALHYALWVLSWWMIGRGALQGHLEMGWLLAWVLLLATILPVRLLASWSAGLCAIGAGGLLKLRLLQGALRLEPEEIRQQGAGQLLGRVLESEAVESLALSGGFLAIVSLLELVGAAVILALGAGGALHVGLLAAVLALTWTLTRAYRRRRVSWTRSRLTLTHDLVEQMAGHRTRLVQEDPTRWHQGEDAAVSTGHREAEGMDRAGAALAALPPRLWLLLGLAGLAPALVTGWEASPGRLAVSVGGILLAHQALMRLTAGLDSLVGATIAWRQVALLYHAAARPRRESAPSVAARSMDARAGPFISMEAVGFRYGPDHPAVLRNASLEIARGDRILLEGPSGGGKSTLASILTGLRAPTEGRLQLAGASRHELGLEGWRRHVVAAPQFHENHVLTGTFAFNALMGGDWPASDADVARAEELCRALGLGRLLEQMPAGMLQTVGETGWQLSHGERSRLFMARALLMKDAELMVLDESFAALDPESLRQALACVLERARTLMVIAHP